MKYVSDDHFKWDTAEEAQKADELYCKVKARIKILKRTITDEIDKVRQEFPHIEIYPSDDIVDWNDKRPKQKV